MQIFSLFGEILLKDNGVENKLDNIDKKGKKTSSSLGNSFGKIGSAALKVGSIIGVSLGFKEMIDGASKSQQRLAQMDTVLKSTGGAAGMTKDELVKLADAQGKLTTFSKGANIETENLLLTFTGIGKKVFPDALKTVNDMSQALGQDTKSSAIQLGKALNDPVKGITALQRVGVTFNEQQKKQIETMVKAGNTAGAQKIILAELHKEFGGSAEAAGKTFGGQLTILKNNLLGVGTQMGGTVLPFLQDFITKINNNMPAIKQTITDVLNTVVPKFKEWIDLIGKIAGELLPSFGNSSKDAKSKASDLSKGLNLVTDVLKWIKDNIGIVKAGIIGLTTVWAIQKGVIIAHNIAMTAHKAAQLASILLNGTDAETSGLATAALLIHKGVVAGATAAQWLLNAAMSANPIGIVILAIAGLIAIGILLWKNWDKVKKFLHDLWGSIKKKAVEVFDGLKDFFIKWSPLIVGIIAGPIGALIVLVVKHWDTIKAKTVEVFTSIKNTLAGIWDGIVGGIKGSINAIIGAINGMIGGMNKLKIDIPDWVPGMGGKKWGLSIPKIPMLAKGTDFFSGGLALVGEQGAELVNLPRGSQVIPHNDTSKALNNRPIYITLKTILDGKVIATGTAKWNDLIQGSTMNSTARGLGL